MADLMMTKKQVEKGEVLARPVGLDIPADIEIVTREITHLAGVILEVARYESADGAVPAVKG